MVDDVVPKQPPTQHDIPQPPQDVLSETSLPNSPQMHPTSLQSTSQPDSPQMQPTSLQPTSQPASPQTLPTSHQPDSPQLQPTSLQPESPSLQPTSLQSTSQPNSPQMQPASLQSTSLPNSPQMQPTSLQSSSLPVSPQIRPTSLQPQSPHLRPAVPQARSPLSHVNPVLPGSPQLDSTFQLPESPEPKSLQVHTAVPARSSLLQSTVPELREPAASPSSKLGGYLAWVCSKIGELLVWACGKLGHYMRPPCEIGICVCLVPFFMLRMCCSWLGLFRACSACLHGTQYQPLPEDKAAHRDAEEAVPNPAAQVRQIGVVGPADEDGLAAQAKEAAMGVAAASTPADQGAPDAIEAVVKVHPDTLTSDGIRSDSDGDKPPGLEGEGSTGDAGTGHRESNADGDEQQTSTGAEKAQQRPAGSAEASHADPHDAVMAWMLAD